MLRLRSVRFLLPGVASVALLAVSASGEPPAAQHSPARIFHFTTDGFWLNLHHFLYVLGRVEAGMPDIERRAVLRAPVDEERGLDLLSAAERETWRAAVGIYAAGPSRMDLVSDEKLLKMTNRLEGAEELEGLEIDPEWRVALEQAAPQYRRVWWPEHRAMNRAWAGAMEALLAEHGAAVLDFLLRAYGVTWPENGYPVHLSGYANWAGAYSTFGDLLVISSLDDPLRASLAGLELVFHEAAHQFDQVVVEELVAAARDEGLRFGRGLDHAILFFTAGEAVRSVFPAYVPYAHAHGVWNRGLADFLPALESGWRPYLEGESLGDEAARSSALRAVLRALDEGSEPAPPDGDR